MTCENCIHEKVCDNVTEQGLPWKVDRDPFEKWCDLFKSKDDLVEVVRCKDCAYHREKTSECLNPHCSSSFYGHVVKDNHYCSYGERDNDE